MKAGIKKANRALISLLYNDTHTSWHPVVLIECADQSDKSKSGHITKFGTRSYRLDGFFVRGNAIKSIVDDALVSMIRSQGFDIVYIDIARDMPWSGIGEPSYTVKRKKLDNLSPEPDDEEPIDKLLARLLAGEEV